MSRHWKIKANKDTHIVLVHTLAHAEAALRAAHSHSQIITLRSAPGAAHYVGLSFLEALFKGAAQACPEAKHSVIIDCGADAALAHRAMAMGFRRIAFSGPGAMRDKLGQVGRKCRAEMAPARAPAHALDLLDSPDPEGDCGSYFDRRKSQKTK